jgi:hypothetical protein
MTDLGLVVFGDVIDSRIDGPAAARWLRDLAAELDEAYGSERSAPFGFTQGDELQGVLRPEADPLLAVLRASLRAQNPPKRPVPAMRWAIAAGGVEPGEGPATQWTGPAFIHARELMVAARRRRDRLVVRSGEERADRLLDDVAPVLGVLLADLTPRQRLIGKLLVVDGLRQAEAAEQLGIRRPTVSVAAERAHVRDIERLRRASLALLRSGLGLEGALP